MLQTSTVVGAADPDLAALAAERTLRAAELRAEIDDKAMALYDRARSQAEAVLARNPNSSIANFVYFAAAGRVMLEGGLMKNLLALRRLQAEFLERAIALDPRNANALAAKGGILLDLPPLVGGDPAEGLRLLERANSINPGGVGTRVSLAKALARNGRKKEARRQAALAAHYACVQGRAKAFDDAVTVLAEIDGTIARASLY